MLQSTCSPAGPGIAASLASCFVLTCIPPPRPLTLFVLLVWLGGRTCARMLQALHIVPESEWEAFMTAMRSSLPTTFRITGTRE